MIFNVNLPVWVKLTDLGRRIHREQHADLMRGVRVEMAYSPPAEDGDGWSKWAMWELMSTFGPHMTLGMDVPFDTNISLDEPKSACPRCGKKQPIGDKCVECGLEFAK
jgi:hypothetical protein